MKKVDFFIVGAAKSATTSLYGYLDQHPGVCMSAIKEPNYFTAIEIEQQKLYYANSNPPRTENAYHALFGQCGETQRWGEASVSYLFYPETALKIKAYNPASKVIIVLRNPVERAFSHYLMDRRLGFAKKSFEELVYVDKNPLSIQQYLEYGLYTSQIEKYTAAFPAAQIHIVLNEDIKSDAAGQLKLIYNFLEVDQEFCADLSLRHNEALSGKNGLVRSAYQYTWLRKMVKTLLPKKVLQYLINRYFVKQKIEPDAELKTTLLAYYKDEIDKLEKLLNRDLSHWKA